MSENKQTIYDVIDAAIENTGDNLNDAFSQEDLDDAFNQDDVSHSLNRGVNGIWKSDAGSLVLLRSYGPVLRGLFRTTHYGTGHLVGTVDPSQNVPNLALSFSIWWPPRSGDTFRSITSYTGQYHQNNGNEFIHTIFLLADETVPTQDYASVSVGSDKFTRR